MTSLRSLTRFLLPKAIAASDADGEVLRELDVVTLLCDVEGDSKTWGPDVFAGTIPAGSIGTVILIAPTGEMALEFFLNGQPAFADVQPSQVRLHTRLEKRN